MEFIKKSRNWVRKGLAILSIRKMNSLRILAVFEWVGKPHTERKFSVNKGEFLVRQWVNHKKWMSKMNEQGLKKQITSIEG